MAQTFPKFENARTLQIDDSAVEQLIVIGKRIGAGLPLDAASSELVRLTFGPVCQEVLRRRRAMARMGLTGPDDHLRIVNSA